MADHSKARTNVLIRRVLQGGLGAASLLMAAGVVSKLVSGDGSAPAFRPGSLSGLSLADRVTAGGVLVLAATPAVRVVVLLVVWAREGDWRFVGAALAVMLTLTLSIVLASG